MKKEKKTPPPNFAVLAKNEVQIKKKGKDKFIDLMKEMKKPWNIKTTVIPIVFGGAFGTVP